MDSFTGRNVKGLGSRGSITCSKLTPFHSHEQHDLQAERHHHDVRRHSWGWQRCWRLRRRQGRRGRRLRDLRHAQVANREARRHEVAHASSLRSPLIATAIKPREVLSFPQRDDERNSWVAQGVGECAATLSSQCGNGARWGQDGCRPPRRCRKSAVFRVPPALTILRDTRCGVSDSLFRLRAPAARCPRCTNCPPACAMC